MEAEPRVGGDLHRLRQIGQDPAAVEHLEGDAGTPVTTGTDDVAHPSLAEIDGARRRAAAERFGAEAERGPVRRGCPPRGHAAAASKALPTAARPRRDPGSRPSGTSHPPPPPPEGRPPDHRPTPARPGLDNASGHRSGSGNDRIRRRGEGRGGAPPAAGLLPRPQRNLHIFGRRWQPVEQAPARESPGRTFPTVR